jgi:hypothetical protein
VAVNPYTLQEETEEDRRARNRLTGELGEGVTVLCRPTDDPEVVQQQHRAVCLTRPYNNCSFCRHANFTLVFLRKNREDVDRVRRQQVRCPRWDTPRGYLSGKAPDHYASVEVGTCELKPFDFCHEGCPTDLEGLVKLGIDKTRDEWYSRWRRFTKNEEDEEDEDG